VVSTYKSLSAGNADENRGERSTERKGRGKGREEREMREELQGKAAAVTTPSSSPARNCLLSIPNAARAHSFCKICGSGVHRKMKTIWGSFCDP
jgi:hypothetical protein